VKTTIATLLVCWSVAVFAQAKDSPPDAAKAEGSDRFALVKGATLPDFVYTDFAGSQHRFSDLHAKYRLIDFWATWCTLCIEDLPSKRAIYRNFHRRGFEILSIDGQEREPGAAERLIARRAIPWPQARFDRSLVLERFAAYELPTFVLVDSHNVIVSATTNSPSGLAGDALGKLLSTLLPPR
jgi:thiol-disulfide isomerase/thioredoxin